MFYFTFQTRHPLHHCYVNSECNGENLCCSYTAVLGRRSVHVNAFPPDGMVHYCLPYKNENATWCDLRLQYATDITHYVGLCPCGPGLKCTPTEDLDSKYYPRDRYGKCTKIM